jgi:Undecaprenyl-phosphate glucose phosphotransferase
MLLNDAIVSQHTFRQLLPGRATAVLRIIEGFVVAGLGLVIYLMYVQGEISLLDGRYLVAIAAATLISQILSQWLCAYELTAHVGDPTHTARALCAWALTFAVLLLLAFVIKITGSYSRVWAVSWFVGVGVSILVVRVSLGQWLIRRAQEGRFALRTVIVGTGSEGQRLADLLGQRDDCELKILGFVEDRLTQAPTSNNAIGILGNMDDLIQMIRAELVDQVIIALPWQAEERLQRLLDQLSLTPVRVCMSAFLSNLHVWDRNILQVSGLPMVEVFGPPISGSAHILKRMEDLVLGSLLLLFVAPLILLIAIAVKIDSRGPIFFRQVRQGYNDSLIAVWKFRTMYATLADPDCIRQTSLNDPRVTRIGQFLRRSSLDELPQLFNVINGTMSLVGPRPHALETKAEGRRFADIVDRYAARHRVKPGITGLAQVNGWRGETDTVEKIKHRVEYDLYYIEHWSLWLDLWILVKTLWVVLRGENAY